MSTENKAIVVTKDELSLVENNSLNQNQLGQLLKTTPAKYVKERPAKGGGKWRYVTGGYVKKCLNLMFGWDWDFEIIDERIEIEAKEVIVKGKLTCRSNGAKIVKMQYGNKDIMFKKNTSIPLSIGNDMKAAATDCLKKCAAEIGIAADIYNPEEFREIQVKEDVTHEELKALYDMKKDNLPDEEQMHMERILDNNETGSYNKMFKNLQSK
ncbi:MAG: hypothetical protein KAJ19_14790 [Gammaproteobacteria bacterium]|nr:hypothetical protein [Gammaproteobacteria bacterium]